MKKGLFALFFIVAIAIAASAQRKLTVLANKPVTEIAPTMWGVFFEDINFGADGGLYAELVKNRSFEFTRPLMGWKEIRQNGGTGSVLIINLGNDKPQNPRFARIRVNSANGAYGLSNEGFRGMGIQKGNQYNFSLLARRGEGNVQLRAELVSATGKKLGSASISNINSEWTKHAVSFTSSDTALKAHLDVWFEGQGTVDVDMISLFPQNTWKNRPNGLRADLVQMLADLKPGFIRFPGGCIVEGFELETRYQWKKTVGAIEDRTQTINRWNTEFRNRLTPDYFQSFGLGFYEYFLLAEDIGAEPLPILNCGMACQYNSGEVVPLDQLDVFVQDALDLIEFANGAVTTKWGKLRADMGHPAPFNMKYLGVGNEQWGVQYIERYKEFEKKLKQLHPEIKLAGSAGPAPEGDRFDYCWTEFKKLQTDVVDEHYYQSPEWFLKNASRYDKYDRKGPKVFAGEYAAHTKDNQDPESRNTWLSALAEAAFMTGLERNADVVKMASYAPLFAHVEAWQWRPDLIWFDNLRTVGTPNYYVQKMFAVNKGTHVVPVLEGGQILAGKDSVYASSTIDKVNRQLIIKLVNVSGSPVAYDIDLKGIKPAGKEANMQVLSSNEPMSYNTLDRQQTIYPVDSKLKLKSGGLQLSLPPMSLNIIKVPVRN